MTTRPPLSLFPSTEPRSRSAGSNRIPANGTSKNSLDKPRVPADVHGLVIQIPEAAHQRPVQIHHNPPKQQASPSRKPSVTRSRRTSEDIQLQSLAAKTSSSPSQPWPVRSASLDSQLRRAQRTVTSASPARLEPVVGSPITPTNSSNRPPSGGVGNDARASFISSMQSRVASPASGFSQCPTLVRTMSTRTATQSPSNTEQRGPMRSIFPHYNPQVPLAEQQYVPARHVTPSSQISLDKISRAPYSPPLAASFSVQQPYFTPAAELPRLWNFSNGIASLPAEGPSQFSLPMRLSNSSTSSNSKTAANAYAQVEFGTDPERPFYSVRQSDPVSATASDEIVGSQQLQEHELLLLRHHPSKAHVIPISHMDISPPPPPSLSKTTSAPIDYSIDIENSAADAAYLPHHVTTIEPAMASLAALKAAADSPIAALLSQADPNAVSPEARSLAENAIAHAKEQESAELTWHATGPGSGAYELLHPALGSMKFVVEGTFSDGFEFGNHSAGDRTRAKISLLSPRSNNQPMKHEYRAAQTDISDFPRLVTLDLAQGLLQIDTAALTMLQNQYICDVAVAAVFSVSMAESRRARDPGLIFAAPPILPPTTKSTSKPKPKGKLKSKPQKQQGPDGWEEKELPRSARVLIAILSFFFKSALWVVGLGLRMVFRILRGIGSCIMRN